jgi:hypothetical protein
VPEGTFFTESWSVADKISMAVTHATLILADLGYFGQFLLIFSVGYVEFKALRWRQGAFTSYHSISDRRTALKNLDDTANSGGNCRQICLA